MPLSSLLRQVELTLACKHCGHSLIKKGDWFVVAHRFKCKGCNREVPITYSDKIALFGKHVHLSRPSPRPSLASADCADRGAPSAFNRGARLHN
jgi:hypothetical protein